MQLGAGAPAPWHTSLSFHLSLTAISVVLHNLRLGTSIEKRDKNTALRPMTPSTAHWHISCSIWGTQRNWNGCGKIPSKSGGKHGLTPTHRAFRLSKISRLLTHAIPWSKVAALHRRHSADRRQFLGLPGVSRYPPLPALFGEV